MSEALAQILSQGQGALFVGFVLLLRVGGLVALAPGFGEQSVPARIKLALVLAVVIVLLPAMADRLAPLRARPGLPLWMLGEIATGVFLGLGLRGFVFALQLAGTMAAQATSLAQLLGGSAGEPQPAIGNLMVMAGLALLMTMGFPLHLVEFVLGSYQVLPVGGWPDAAAMKSWGLGGIVRAFSLAFMIAAPFVITGLVYNVALGAINRAMPQLMVALVGAPGLTMGGLLLLALALPAGLELWREGVAELPRPSLPGGAMSEEEADDKQFEPTPHKLEEARKKGDLVRSSEIAVAAVYAGFLLAALTLGPYAIRSFGSHAMEMLARADTLSVQLLGGGTALGAGLVLSTLLPAVPFLLAPMIAALIAYLAQRAIVVAPEKLMPKLDRINPIANAGRKFGRNGLFEFAKSAVKLAVITTVLALFLQSKLELILVAQRLSPGQASGVLMRLIVEFMMLVTALAALIGGLDYLWQRADFLRRNRMSRKELMDEMKHSEGDPHLKAQRRQRGIAIATGQSLRDTAKADVVIVNPTHYAVALKWDRASGRAPVCLAKGVDELALKMREIAAENGVPIRPDPPTARAIFAAVEVGEEIRPEHYKPVAAAIRFAEAMRRRARARGRR